jgi:hypothetical protein
MIKLDRQFEEWSEKEPSDPEVRSAFRWFKGGLRWSDLLSKPRVVILPEAGSGKTEEMREQPNRLGV